MKKYIVKILAFTLVAVTIYIGVIFYQKYSKIGVLIYDVANFGEALTDKLMKSPIVTQELYSADSTLKVGVYRFLIAGENGFESSNYHTALIDTSATYPKRGNILSDVKTRPIAFWISPDSILIKSDSTIINDYNLEKRLQGITILVNE